MPYSFMTPKQKRIVERDVESLFSPSAFLRCQTLDSLKRLGFFHPNVKFQGNTIFLSERATAALRRLADLLSDASSQISDAVSRGDIRTQVHKSYNEWLEKLLQPTGEEFVAEVVQALRGQVKSYEFLVQVEGLDIKDQDKLKLGSMTICPSDVAILQNVEFEGNLDCETIYSQFKDSLWLMGSATGTENVASEQFQYRTILIVGILAICGALLYKGSTWRTRVRAVTSPLEHRKAVFSLRWEAGGAKPTLSQNWGGEQALALDTKSIEYLTSVCFLGQLCALPDKRDRSELEEAILRSIYWFAEAYRDRNHTMQFMKLWTCSECFFAIEKKEITEMNAKGISSILAFAGYRIIDHKDYVSFKRRVKRLYDFRSRAIHRGEFRHLGIEDLDDLSEWVAWVIVSMVALTGLGYTKLSEVHEQTSRLDQLSTAREGNEQSNE